MQIYLPRTIGAKAPGPHPAVKHQTAETAHILVVDDDLFIAGQCATHIVCAGRQLPDENPVTSPAGVPVVAVLVFVMPR